VKNDIHDLGLVLDSRIKLVLIESWDELRVLETLTAWPYAAVWACSCGR
jgi:hypothetical protein